VSASSLQIWYAEGSTEPSFYESILDKHRYCLPENLIRKIESFRSWKDRQLSLLGKLLLCRALDGTGDARTILSAYSLGENGRPYVNLPGAPDFSISHSGLYAVCAVAQGGGRVGADIELIRDVDVSDFKSFLPASAWSVIEKSSNKVETFCKYWTICEAVAKGHGGGVGGPVGDIEIQRETAQYFGQTWALQEVKIDSKYSCHVALNQASSSLLIPKVNFGVKVTN